MSECICKVTARGRRRVGYQMGPHHEIHCPLWFEPTRVPGHAQEQVDRADTATELARAITDEDTMREHCE